MSKLSEVFAVPRYQPEPQGVMCACGHPRHVHYPGIKYCSVAGCDCKAPEWMPTQGTNAPEATHARV